MTEVYVAVIKDPAFHYSGEPEAWRENIELLFSIAVGTGSSFKVSGFAGGLGIKRRQVDWATTIAELDLSEIERFTREHQDMAGFRSGALNDVLQLAPGPRYALVTVEGIS